MSRDSPTALCPVILSDTWAQGHGTRQSQHTTAGMHQRTAGKVVESKFCEPSATPAPMARNGIDNCRNEHRVDQIVRELGTFSHGTAHNRSRRSAEHGLENKECRHRQVLITAIGTEEKTVPTHETMVSTKHQREADNPKQHASAHKVAEILHQDVRRILRARHACLHQGEAGLHPEHEHCSQ